MKVTKLDGPFGVEVSGLDPVMVCEADGAALRRLLFENQLVVLRDVEMSSQDHVRLMSRFGSIMVEMEDADTLADPAHLSGQVSFVTTRPNEYISGRDALGFHSDFSYTVEGAGPVLSLYALEAEREDPTIFVHMGLALRHMPVELADRLRGLELVKCCNFFHNTSKDFGPRYRMSHRDPSLDYGDTASLSRAVIRHPVTGEELVNICQTFTSHVKGWSYAESNALFAEVERWQYAEANRVDHRWRKRDLVIWDNIALQHGRAPVSEGSVRHLRRVACNQWTLQQLWERTGAALVDASVLEATG